MPSTTSRRLGAPLAIVLGAFLALAGIVTPASAHDTLVGADPADGAQVEQGPEQLTLEFNNNLIDSSKLVRVTDAAGASWTSGDPQVVGAVVTQALLPDMPAGEYTVEWSVVSSDGHPIDSTTAGDGVHTFTVTVGAEPSAAPEDSASPDPEMTTQTAPDEEDGAQDDGPIEGSAGNDMTPLIGIVGALVGIGVLAALILLITRAQRRRRSGS